MEKVHWGKDGHPEVEVIDYLLLKTERPSRAVSHVQAQEIVNHVKTCGECRHHVQTQLASSRETELTTVDEVIEIHSKS